MHAVFTRHGGTSNPPFLSLNTSYSTGDDPDHVRRNLSTIMEVMGGENLLYMNQVHGREILVLRGRDSSGFPQGAEADAVITDRKNLVLMVKQADCQGVLLYDPVTRVIAAAHCGWRGNVLNILGSLVERMVSEFGCSRSRIIAVIGPSLGPCCAEFIDYPRIFPRSFRSFMLRENYFDLWQISSRQLLEAGLEVENIEVAGACTVCRTDLFFSYRAEKTTGRFATAIMLT
jgi:YfiH family protein